MANRKRNIQMKFWVTEEEKTLIEKKMKLLPTQRYGAYLRKMAIDGYIIYTDTADIKESERKIMELTLQIKHAEIYRQLKPVYEKYRQSNDPEKFLRGHEREIILFETARRELQKLNLRPLPSAGQMQLELQHLQ